MNINYFNSISVRMFTLKLLTILAKLNHDIPTRGVFLEAPV